MPQVLRYRLDIVAVLQAQRRKAMAKVMETDMAKPDAFQDSLQMVVHRHAGEMLPQFVRKDQVPFVAEYSRFESPMKPHYSQTMTMAAQKKDTFESPIP